MSNQISCAGVSEKHLWILWAIQSADQKANSNKTHTTTVRIHGSREGTDLLIILSNSAEISSHTHCLLFKKTEKLCGNTEGENVKQYVGIRRDTNKCCQDTSALMDTTEFNGKNMHYKQGSISGYKTWRPELVKGLFLLWAQQKVNTMLPSTLKSSQ